MISGFPSLGHRLRRHAQLLQVVGCTAVLLPSAACVSSSSKCATAPQEATQTEAQAEVVAPKVADAAATAEVLPWIENDLDTALAQARARHVPVFVDLWATWCHTCLSMRAYVFNDPGAQSLRDRAVWLAVDVDLPSSDGIVKKYPFDALPTFFVIDPQQGSAIARWSGSMSLSDVRGLIEEGESGLQRDAKVASSMPWLSLVQAAEAASANQDFAQAAENYRQALAAAPSDWPRRPSIFTAQIAARRRAGANELCLAEVSAALPSLANTASTADTISYALGCLSKTPADSNFLHLAGAKLSELVQDTHAPLSADDRSDAYAILSSVQEALGQPEKAQQSLLARLAVLENAASQAPSPAVASTYDGARLETLLELGRPQDAIAFLEASAKALPNDYNPRGRLAKAYLASGNLLAARAVNRRALEMAYGARKIVLFLTQAEIEEKDGNWELAKSELEQAIEFVGTLPASQTRPGMREGLEARLVALSEREQAAKSVATAR